MSSNKFQSSVERSSELLSEFDVLSQNPEVPDVLFTTDTH